MPQFFSRKKVLTFSIALIIAGILYGAAVPLLTNSSFVTVETAVALTSTAAADQNATGTPEKKPDDGVEDPGCSWYKFCWVAGLLSTIISLLITLLGKLLTFLVMAVIFFSEYNGFITSPAVVLGWNIVRDIGNMFFVLILLLISFGTILNIEQYQMKRLLPKVLLMAVLVNFSKLIAGVLIDFSQVIMLTFVNAYSEVGAGNFVEALKLQNLLSIDTASGVTTNSWTVFAGYFLALIYIIVAFFVVGAFVAILVVRIVYLWMLIILSPLVYVLSVVPIGQKYASQWWEMFSKYVIVGPVLAFFLWLSLATLPNLMTNDKGFPPVVNSQDQSVGADPSARVGTGTDAKELISISLTEAGSTSQLVGFIVGIGMLLVSLQFAMQIGGAVGKIAGAAYGKLSSMGMAAVRGPAKALGGWINYNYQRATGGWTSPKLWKEALQHSRDIKLKKATKGTSGYLEDVFEHGIIKSAFLPKEKLKAIMHKKRVKEARDEKIELDERNAVAKGSLVKDESDAALEEAHTKDGKVATLSTEIGEEVKTIGEVFSAHSSNITSSRDTIAAKEVELAETEERVNRRDALRPNRLTLSDTELAELAGLEQTASTDDRKLDALNRLRSAYRAKIGGDDGTEAFDKAEQEAQRVRQLQANAQIARQAKNNYAQNPDPTHTKEQQRAERDRLEQETLDAENNVAVGRVSLAGMQVAALKESSTTTPDKRAVFDSVLSDVTIKEHQRASLFQEARQTKQDVATGNSAALLTIAEKRAEGTRNKTQAELDSMDVGSLSGQEANRKLERIAELLAEENRTIEQLNSLQDTATPTEQMRLAAEAGRRVRRRDELVGEQGALQKYQSSLANGQRSEFAATQLAPAEQAVFRKAISRSDATVDFKRMTNEEMQAYRDGVEETKVRAAARVNAIREEQMAPSSREDIEARSKKSDQLKHEIDEKKATIIASVLPRYYREQARRELVAEESKKLTTSNYHELIQYFKQAEHEGDKYKMSAVLHKLTNDLNENELTNDLGYSSDFEGYKQFFDERFINNKKIGMSRNEALALASDVSSVAEAKNHWDVARTVDLDATTGNFRWKNEKEHVTEVLAELQKISPREIANRFNRLAYGGEVPVPGGRKFKLGALGTSILMTLGPDLANFMSRHETNKNAIVNIYSSFKEYGVPHSLDLKNIKFNKISLEDMIKDYSQFNPDVGQRYEEAVRGLADPRPFGG